jgi:hypothetical protein
MMAVLLDQPTSLTTQTGKPILQGLLQPLRAATRSHLTKHTDGPIHIIPTIALASERERRVIPGRTQRWMIWQMLQLPEAVLLALSTADRPLPTSIVIPLKTSDDPPSESNQTDFHNQLGNLKILGLTQVTSMLHNRRRLSFSSISRHMFTSRPQRNTINSKVPPPSEGHLMPSKTLPQMDLRFPRQMPSSGLQLGNNMQPTSMGYIRLRFTIL